MKFKDNWPEAREHWAALWAGRYIRRPCISVCAPSGQPRTVPPPASPEQKWLDPDYIVRDLLDGMRATWYGGESIPSYLLMAGWVVNTYGATPRFSMETIWFDPVAVDWNDPPAVTLDLESPWFKKVIAVYTAALAAAGRDDFLVGRGCFMPGNDMLALVIGAERMMMAMADHPEWTRSAILKLARNVVELQKRFRSIAAQTHDFWYGNGGWMPFWAPEPFVSTQSDISCMLSPEMYGQFVLPELDLLGREFKHVWYHLDGQSAFQHLPRLLSLPYVKVIQFTPEAGTPANGPAHLDLYRRIQKAGKIVHIQVPACNIEPLVKSLDPGLLCIDTWCGSIREGKELLAAAERWTAR